MRSTALVPVVVVSLFLAIAGCQTAEFDKPKPDTVVVALSDDAITADDGALVVMAQALEDGVPITGREIRITLTGANPQAEQALLPDEATGYVTTTLSNLRTAGTTTVTAAIGVGSAEVTQAASFVVTPGAPATLLFTITDQDIEAGQAPGFSAVVRDAFTNEIANPPVLLTTTSLEATILSSGLIEFRREGTWDVHATMAGTALDEVDQVTVSETDPAQVVTRIDRTLLDPAETLRIQCNEYDVFSNDRTVTGTFTAGTEVFTTPPSTITAVAGTAGLFTASGFTSNGAYLARCQNGALDDTKAFSVVPATGTNSVLATVSQNLVDAGLTITVNCKQLDPFGAILPTPAAGFTFTLPTNPSGATHDGGAGDASPADGIDFVIGGGQSLDVLGTHVGQCAAGALTDTEDFAVIDLTAPVITQADITAMTGPLGPAPTADDRYAPGATLTVTTDATDLIGVRVVMLEVVSGAAGNTQVKSLLPVDPTVVDETVTGTIDINAATFSTVQFQVRVEDASGNVDTLLVSDLATVDPAVALAVPAGVTLRTLYESPVDNAVRTTALASDGTDLFVQRATFATGNILDVQRITGDTAPASVSTFLSTGLPSVAPSGGAVALPAAFGGRTWFQTLDDPAVTIGSESAGAHVAFAGTNGAMAPGDLTFGDLGGGPFLFLEDEGGAIFTTDSAGAIAPYTAVVSSGLSLTMDGSTLWAASQGGDLFSITDAAGTGSVAFVANLGPTLALNTVADLAFGNGQLVLTDGGGLLTRVNTAGTVRTDITGSLIDVDGLAVKTGGNLYVLVEPSGGGFYRIYKVTGY